MLALAAACAALQVATTLPPDLVVPRGLSRLLTQRAVQQTIFYSVINKDEVIGRWLGAYAQRDDEHGLSPDFHGIDALPVPCSAQYVCGLLAAPPTLLSVQRRAMPCGGSLENPYLNKKKFDEVALEVPTKKLAERVMAMRELVAEEWSADLELFGLENDALRSRHLAAMRAGAAGSAGNVEAAAAEAARSLPPFEAGRLSSEAGRSSPFRLASYDLLKSLATRDAMGRVLRRLGEGRPSEQEAATAAWLERWWEQRRSDFVGHRPWRHGHGEPGAADALLCELVAAAPTATVRPSGDVVLVDPSALVEALLEERQKLAADWAQALARVPEAHLQWRRWGLEGTVCD